MVANSLDNEFERTNIVHYQFFPLVVYISAVLVDGGIFNGMRLEAKTIAMQNSDSEIQNPFICLRQTHAPSSTISI